MLCFGLVLTATPATAQAREVGGVAPAPKPTPTVVVAPYTPGISNHTYLMLRKVMETWTRRHDYALTYRNIVHWMQRLRCTNTTNCFRPLSRRFRAQCVAYVYLWKRTRGVMDADVEVFSRRDGRRYKLKIVTGRTLR